MVKRDFEDISRFLATVGKSNLFEYYGIETTESSEEVEAAIRKRRVWAQGQQANPKFRTEAIWLLKNVSLSRRALIEHRTEYLEEIRGRDQQRNLQVLRLFVMGTLAEGVLTPKGEEAIQQQGEGLGLDQATISGLIGEVLEQTGSSRQSSAAPQSDAMAPSHYSVLGVEPDVELNTLERAYRERYQAARQLHDPRRAAEIYQRLDEAWQVLKEPASRARYDEQLLATQAAAAAAIPTRESTPIKVLSAPQSAVRFGREVERQIDPKRSRELTFAEQQASEDDESPELNLRSSAEDPPAPPPVSKPSPSNDWPRSGSRLVIDGPTVRKVRARRKKVVVPVVVRNEGDGPMHGRVFADREWLTVSPENLDAKARQQEILVTIDPTQMPRSQAVSLVTVLTTDQVRRSVTFEVECPSYRRRGIVLAVILLLIAGGLYLYQNRPPPPPPPEPPPRVDLWLQVDPPAGEISVNGELVSSQGQAHISEGLPIGRSFTITVALDGFADWSKELTLEPGASERLSAELELQDPMSFQPTPDQLRGDVDSAEIRSRLQSRHGRLDNCMALHISEPEGFTAVLDFTGYISTRGYVVGVDITEQNRDMPAVEKCLKRELRAIRMPLVAGDYGMFHHALRYTVPLSTDKGSGP